jgi:hypothetical protein
MQQIPFNAVPMTQDDSGKRVVVNSVGGALWNAKGTVLYGPHIYKYEAITKKNPKDKAPNAKMVKKILETCPLWNVLLDGYNLQIRFAESELTFN